MTLSAAGFLQLGLTKAEFGAPLGSNHYLFKEDTEELAAIVTYAEFTESEKIKIEAIKAPPILLTSR